ncbi:MAG: hypothetical protein ACREB0_00105 [Sphingopyxis sp.]
MPLGNGLDVIPLRIPAKWDAAWFETFCRDVLALGDVRNSDTGPGITVEGTSDGTATISATADVEAVADAAFILSSGADPALPNSRGLEVENGVFLLETSAGVIRLVLVDGGIFGNKIRPSAALSIMGNPNIAPAAAGVVDIVAGNNDTIMRRVADVLDFGELTVDMAPDALWPYAKIQDVSAGDRVLGRKTSIGPIEELEASEVLDMLGAAADGAVLVKVAGVWTPLAPGADDQVLTMVSGAPAWADLPDFALADATFVTEADESATLPNARQLTDGANTTINTATAGEIQVDAPP